MSFSKKKIIIVFSVCIIVFLLVLAMLFFNNKPNKELIVAVDKAWNTAKTEDQPEYLTKLDELTSYELNSVEQEGDRYIIEASVMAPDLGGQLSKIDYSKLSQTESTEDINAFLCEQIEKAEIQKTISYIYAYKINGKYQISFSENFVDAMSGNLYSYSQTTLVDMLQKYMEGELK